MNFKDGGLRLDGGCDGNPRTRWSFPMSQGALIMMVGGLLVVATTACNDWELGLMPPKETTDERPLRSCIDVEPQSLTFTHSALGTPQNQAIRISNCGIADLSITSIGTTADTHPVFLLGADTIPEGLSCSALGLPPERCAGEHVLESGESHTFVVSFTPTILEATDGTVVIQSTVPGSEQFLVALHGRVAIESMAPVPVAEARIQESLAFGVYPAEYEALETVPLKTIDLRGSNSYDPRDGEITTYLWSVAERPTDSAAQIMPNSNQADVAFFLDLVGTYRFDLLVVNQDGVPSEDTAKVWVIVTSDRDIHVQLMWQTPGGAPLPEPQGTDLDLHFLHPQGTWFDRTWDCFYGNPEPRWSPQGAQSGNPTLDIDDLLGPGPENINLDRPQSGLTYSVGVHYYCDNNYGYSLATVRIFIHGTLREEQIQHRMNRTNDFWYVADIHWPSATVTLVNHMQTGTGGCRH